jgi:hypothetical protein
MEKRKTNKIRFEVLVRMVSRIVEVVENSDTPNEVKCVYEDAIAPATDAFRKSHDAVAVAKSAYARASLQSQQMLGELDPVCCTTRSIVLAVDPAQILPATLKAQPTDTDALRAIATLVSVVKSHAGEPWADAIIAGQFGTLAPKAEAALKATIAASDALEKARNQRRAACLPAYDGYLAFKRIVRDMLGSSSRAYRRLTLRTAGAASEPVEPADIEAGDEAPDSAVLPASKGTPVTAAGPSSVRVA